MDRKDPWGYCGGWSLLPKTDTFDARCHQNSAIVKNQDALACDIVDLGKL